MVTDSTSTPSHAGAVDWQFTVTEKSDAALVVEDSRNLLKVPTSARLRLRRETRF